MENETVSKNFIEQIIDKDIAVSFNDHVCAFLTGEITRHDDQPQLPCDPVSISRAALPHNTVGFLNGFLRSNQHSGITPSGQNGTVSI